MSFTLRKLQDRIIAYLGIGGRTRTSPARMEGIYASGGRLAVHNAWSLGGASSLAAATETSSVFSVAANSGSFLRILSDNDIFVRDTVGGDALAANHAVADISDGHSQWLPANETNFIEIQDPSQTYHLAFICAPGETANVYVSIVG